jgi:protein O-GlcNAc transferase
LSPARPGTESVCSIAEVPNQMGSNQSDTKTGGVPVSELFQNEADRLEREIAEHWVSLLAASLDALRKEASDDNTRIRAAYFLRKLSRHDEAIGLLEEGLRPRAAVALYHAFIDVLAECNRTRKGIAAAQEASLIFPGDFLLNVKAALLLPVLYDSTAEIDWYRARFTAGLRRLCEEVRLDTPEARLRALMVLRDHTNFYLGYQCRNDRELQTAYGALAHRIMAANYPQWTAPIEMPPSPNGEPLRIGYVSSRFRDLSATRFFLGWLREHDRTRYQICSWHVGGKRDHVTDEVSRISHRFFDFSATPQDDLLEKTAASIRDCNLHVLIFLDIGLDPVMTQLGALRLAPVQCMAWDQPITSGLPTMDYALSSDLAEPTGAEAHYSEQLIRLPGVGVSYQQPAIPWPLLRKTRQDFSLREDSVVYLCCQSVFKFLPDNDDVFVQIASRVRNAQFVFVVTNPLVGFDFSKRLERAFGLAGLRAEDHCVMMPQLKHLDYWNLHGVADIFLDTIGWSSGGSVFESIACKLPVVTMPGEFMRGRQAAAILTQLGVMDTIVGSKREYVDCAVRLGENLPRRRAIVERMVRGYPLLYSDRRSTATVEEFIRGAVAKTLRPQKL